MNAEQYLKEALGGNMNIATLKPLAWHKIMEGYAKQKLSEELNASDCPDYSAGQECVLDTPQTTCGEKPCRINFNNAVRR